MQPELLNENVPASSDTLPEKTIKAIALEEKVRARIRAELEPQTPKVSESGLWKFLNSTFGLFLLSSVLVTGVGGFLTHLQQRARERDVHNQRALILLTEFDWRLKEIEYQARTLVTAADKDKGPVSLYIWRATVGDKGFAPTLPEFKEVHMAGIVSQLKSLGFTERSDDAFTALKEIENGATIRIEPWGVYDPQFLTARIKTLHEYR